MNSIDIHNELDMLTKGLLIRFVKYTPSSSIYDLMSDLKESKFIDENTRLSHFGVLFGIPLYKEDAPFQPIRWLKNQQLFRHFIYNILSDVNTSEAIRIVAVRLFSGEDNKKKPIPYSDKRRLLASSDYDTLEIILKRFKMRSHQ